MQRFQAKNKEYHLGKTAHLGGFLI